MKSFLIPFFLFYAFIVNSVASTDIETDKKPTNKSVYFDGYQRLTKKVLHKLESGRVKTCHIEEAPLTTDEVKLIASNTGIRKLTVLGSDIKSEDWQHLNTITGLTSLDISHNRFGNTALRELKNIGGLRRFHCWGTPLNDDDLRYIVEAMPKLKDLNVSSCGLKDSALPVLLTIKELKYVILTRNNFTREALKQFKIAAKKSNLMVISKGIWGVEKARKKRKATQLK